MSLLDMQRFREVANEDPEFSIAARYWSSSLKLGMGDAGHLLTIQDGKITVIEPVPAQSDVGDIRISGPAEDWGKILEPVPPPFYQDIFAATVYHGLAYEGDLELMFAYYPALRRMVEIMRECATA